MADLMSSNATRAMSPTSTSEQAHKQTMAAIAAKHNPQQRMLALAPQVCRGEDRKRVQA